MFRSIAEMARKRDPEEDEAEETPTEEVVSLTPAERQRLRARRQDKKLKQSDLATKIGVTPATISNIETGRHQQVKKSIYAKLVQALFGKAADASSVERNAEAFKTIVDGAVQLDEAGLRAVSALVASLARKSTR